MATKRAQEIQKAELERKKRDLYEVFNPTSQDMKVVLNLKVNPEEWTIHADKVEIVPFYVARIYARKMSDRIIYSKSDKAVIEENRKRMEKGFGSMDVHTEQFRFESRILKNLSTKRQNLMKILIVGLYKEYGIGEKGTTAKTEEDIREMETDKSVDEALGIKHKETPQEQRERALEKAREAKKAKKAKEDAEKARKKAEKPEEKDKK
jgi:hypothetical protein